MREPLTEELLHQLLSAPDPSRFTEESVEGTPSLPVYLQGLLDEKGLVRSAVIREAGLNETFGYQIFMGQRNATRDKLLQLVFALGCTLKEANRLLYAGGASQLYCKNRRDAIIIYCIDRRATLMRVNEELYRMGEETIC